MRFAPDRPWLPFRAEQTFTGDGIDFRWEAQVRMAPLVRARVVDSLPKWKRHAHRARLRLHSRRAC
jgi:hypothetical protein